MKTSPGVRGLFAGGALMVWALAPALSAETGLQAGSGFTDAPVRFTCEGILRGQDGKLLQGRHRLGFTLFRGGSATEPDSGTLLYGETAEVEVRDGRAVHAVGTGTPTFGTLSPQTLSQAGRTGTPEEVLWIQIAVGEEQRPLLPRTRLEAAPYAASAGDSERLGGLPADAYVTAAALAKALEAGASEAVRAVKAAGTGFLSFIGGGQNNDASGAMSAIAGGTDNHTTWWAAFVGGGSFNWATGTWSAVAGGLANAAIHDQSFVGGGSENRADGPASTVAGGMLNRASGASSAVPGGQGNTAFGAWSLAAGRRAKSMGVGSFTWADSTNADFENVFDNSFLVRASGGAVFFHNSPFFGFQVENIGSGGGLTASGTSTGVRGSSQSGVGVVAESSANNAIRATTGGGGAAALYATGFGFNSDGVVGEANNGPASNGVWGRSTSGFAGMFSGRVRVSENLTVVGTLAKGAGSFKIDHPLDPENRYLSHSFVESPDMMNVYNGNCILDAGGEAVVELPAYFGALNRDFRYQLTPLGSPAPSLHIAREIENNRFRIAGGAPGMKVSWQVTGIRKDAYAQAHPIVVEQEKTEEERGLYLHPRELGKPADKTLADPSIRRLRKK